MIEQWWLVLTHEIRYIDNRLPKVAVYSLFVDCVAYPIAYHFHDLECKYHFAQEFLVVPRFLHVLFWLRALLPVSLLDETSIILGGKYVANVYILVLKLKLFIPWYMI
jgi:hypothetical protein